MKRFLAVLLTLVICVNMLASCDFLKNYTEIRDGSDSAETTEGTTPEHVHDFVLSETESTPAKCETAGLEVGICACGAREEKVVEPLGHNMKVQMETKPSCTESGTTMLKCFGCGKREYVTTEATGHNFAPTR